MARIRRIVIPNTPHHITQRGVRSMNIFFKHEDYEYYKELLYTQSKLHDLEIISYCLMTNHVHIIAIPKNKESLSKPLDETHFLHALKYVEQNPVKAYMVKYPWDYKYSSTQYRLNLIKEDKLLSNYESIDNIENYKEFLLENTQTKLLEEKTRTGKPCGDDNFYDKIKILTGIDYKNKKAGRPKKEKELD